MMGDDGSLTREFSLAFRAIIRITERILVDCYGRPLIVNWNESTRDQFKLLVRSLCSRQSSENTNNIGFHQRFSHIDQASELRLQASSFRLRRTKKTVETEQGVRCCAASVCSSSAAP